jgi:succinate dehydrogenase / fumarate reductase flavoprotein subunit
MEAQHDVLIIGAGIAGLRAAVELAGRVDVAVVSKVYPTRSHSGAAQGGIAAALGNLEEDRWEWHMFDTVKGSDYLGDQDAIEILTRDAPRAVLELEHMGVPFSRTDEGRIAQRAFGGHTRDMGGAAVKRACYASDRTGRVIMDTLHDQCVKAGVRFYSEFVLVDLLLDREGCRGAVLLDLASGELRTMASRSLLLATGGFGKIYRTSSNCFANTGDGQAIALRRGLPLEDMEFVQFHPTGIRGLGILISEAARGEGGVLRNGNGDRFMERYAPNILDLAPRDIVSRAIMREVREGRGVEGEDYVHLDLTRIGEQRLLERLWEITSFARIYAGVDPVKEPIPVLPTCHYMMGGIPTSADGEVARGVDGSPVPGFYAAGECACVSVHGSNRLGCNSLLDLVVFGRRAGKAIRRALEEGQAAGPGPGGAGDVARERLESLRGARGSERVPTLRRELQGQMMERCSVFRTQEGLTEAREAIRGLRERYREIGVSSEGRRFNFEVLEALELGNLLDLAQVMVESALFREESRGAHYREDFPERDDENYLVHTFAFRDGEEVRIEKKPVTLGRFEPKKRSY